MSDWNIQKELCKLARSDNFNDALIQLKLIGSSEDRFIFTHDKDWTRGGSETYIFRFWIENENKFKKGYIIKAVVAYAPTGNLENILQSWIERRNLLSSNGISTPKLVTFGKGVIVEELIPFKFKDILKQKSQINSNDLIFQLVLFAKTISDLGFMPIDPFCDLHSRGEDLVMIDFGQDLGPASLNSDRDKLFNNLLSTLKRWEVDIADSTYNKIHTIFYSKNISG